jgi:hypothetical protein
MPVWGFSAKGIVQTAITAAILLPTISVLTYRAVGGDKDAILWLAAASVAVLAFWGFRINKDK